MRGTQLWFFLSAALLFSGCNNTFNETADRKPHTIRVSNEPESPELQTESTSDLTTSPEPNPGALNIPQEINALKIGANLWPFLGVQNQRRTLVLRADDLQVFSQERLTDPAAAPLFTIPRAVGSDYQLGFDYDGDGRVDIFEITQISSGETCGDGGLRRLRSLKIYSGHTGALRLATGAIKDPCLSVNGGVSQPYPAVHRGAFQWGGWAGIMAMVPQYLPIAWFFANAKAFHFWNAESAEFANYQQAKPMLQPSANGAKFLANQQPLNGLIVNHGGGVRYIAATSGRFLKYTVGENSSQQLLADAPFLARADLVGRNYGLLQHDAAGNPDLIFLAAGTSAADLFQDFRKYGNANVVLGTDLWAGIERHIAIYNLATNQVSQKFYSYAHDQNDGHTYRGRVTYPARMLLPSKDSAGSKMIYNVFDGSTWNVHITASGTTASQIIIANSYVWDVIERAGGEVDVLMSPIDLNRDVMVPDFISADGTIGSWRKAFYFPQLSTQIQRWQKNSESFALRKSLIGVPDLGGVYPQTATSSNGTGYSFPAQRVLDVERRKVHLVLRDAAGTGFEAALD